MPSRENTTPDQCLSVVMPVFNEAESVGTIISAVLDQPCVGELIVVNDASTDGTRDVLEKIAGKEPRMRLIHHDVNQGKGAALKTGMREARCPYVVVQDADLEYDPAEFPSLLKPILDGKADVVFGSRFAGYGAHRVLYFWHAVGNRFLTTISNMATNLNLTDMETCYKVFRRELLEEIDIEEARFGFEPEITAKVSRLGARIFEVPVSYNGRTYAEGKKIGWRDGVRALWCIIKYNCFAR